MSQQAGETLNVQANSKEDLKQWMDLFRNENFEKLKTHIKKRIVKLENDKRGYKKHYSLDSLIRMGGTDNRIDELTDLLQFFDIKVNKYLDSSKPKEDTNG